MIMVNRKNFFATESVQLGRKYLFHRSLTMKSTIDAPKYKYNLDTFEMKTLNVEFKMK